MARRAALVLFVAFVAGPAMNWPCLFACTAAVPVAADDACHAAAPDGLQLTAGQDCSSQQSAASPFVRTGAPAAFAFAAVPNGMSAHISSESSSASPFVAPDTGPPDCRRVIPLRI
jgi:hypothetical protein